MIDTLISNAFYTLLITYAINKAVSRTPLINNRWLPLITMACGFFVGLAISSYFDQPHLLQNIVAGVMGGSLTTWLDEFINKTLFHQNKDEENK